MASGYCQMTSLTWGVKASLRSYILQTGGEITVYDGAELRGGVIRFPAVPDQPGAFRGTVHFVAHGGMLNWRISDPQLDIQSGLLTVADSHSRRFAIAEIVDRASPRLTSDGATFFEGLYQAGAVLDPLED